MNIRSVILVLLSLSIVPCVQAQRLKVVETHLHNDNGQFKLGTEVGARLPWATLGCWQSGDTDPDSANVNIHMCDPQTGMLLDSGILYAVHLKGGNVVIDSTISVDRYGSLRIAARHQQFFVWQTAGYRPVLLEYEPVVEPAIVKTTKREFDRLKSMVQTFDTVTIDAEMRRRLSKNLLDDQELAWMNSGDLDIHFGRFMPSGVMAVRVDAPIDDFRRFCFDTVAYFSPSVHADYAYALSSDGYFVGQVQNGGDLRVVWEIARMDGYEWHTMWPMVFHSPGIRADEFRWGKDGWLYFRSDKDYYKLQVNIPLKQNCRMTDIEISLEEYNTAFEQAATYNRLRHGRTPTAADSITIGQFEEKHHVPPYWEFTGEDTFFDGFKPGPDIIEIVVGDYCCTYVLGDTVEMESCSMALSADGSLFGGTFHEECTELVPAYVYIYPMLDGQSRVGKPYIYQITPDWWPSWKEVFWGADGWLYIDGFNHDGKNVYHKLHLP